MDKILVAIIGILAAAYLFRRFYMTFKGKNAGCECGSCASNCGQGVTSCEPCSIENSFQEVTIRDECAFFSETSQGSTQG